MKLGLGSKVIITEDFDPIDTTLNPARQRSTHTPSAPPVEIDNDSDADQLQNNASAQYPLLSAKDAIRYIPVLNGDDDIEIEEFINEVREIKNECLQKELLLIPIKVEKIIG